MILFFIQCKQASQTEKSHESSPADTVGEREYSIDIHPISHASMVLQYDQITIYVDPVGPVTDYKLFPDPDLILVTDIHGDHFSLETLKALNTRKAKIIMPPAVAKRMPESFLPQIDVLQNGESKKRFDILITAIPMYNLREEAQEFHPPGRGNGYVINIGQKRLYISGDTEDIPEMRSLQHIDIAFICMNLPYTMPVTRAADAVSDFKPGQVFPYHYKGRPDMSDVAEFKRLVLARNPEIEVIQLNWYPE